MSTPKTPWLVAVALPVPLARRFDYRLPEAIAAEALAPGMRVRVPFGRRTLTGLVVAAPRPEVAAADGKADEGGDAGLARRAGPREYRLLTEVLDTEPVAPADWLALLEWAAGYYLHPLGEVVATALPAGLRAGRSAAAAPAPRHLAPTPSGRAALPLLKAPARRQKAALTALLQADRPEGALAAADVRALLAKGWAEWREGPVAGVPATDDAALLPVLPRERVALTPAQAAALAQLPADAAGDEATAPPAPDASPSGRTRVAVPPGFAVRLLEGVTGSGKTELYLELAARTLALGRQVLVLVPEIGLTPQLADRFVRRFGAEHVAVSHSGLTEPARLKAWLGVRDRRVPILVGTRSAVFAPFADLGLVVVDEEHDASFKQQEGFRYHARDLAIVRARHHGALVVLGSATPSLESLANAAAGRYRRVRLAERVGGGAPPLPVLIDLNRHPARDGLSEPLAEAVQRHVAAGGQALLFINRRGYAPTLFCEACHWVAPCPHCDARLTLHRDRRLHCHHCGHVDPAPRRCPVCGGLKLAPLGEGTERLEEALKNLLPGQRVERFDSARFNTAGQLHALLDDVREARVPVLVGTQMLAKGHDFGRLSLVGVVNADAALYSADFRATERLGQLLVQVAGRAGRTAGATLPPEVLIQTRDPAHPALQTLLREGYAGFAERLLAERATSGLPPAAHLAVLRAESADAAEARAFLLAALELVPMAAAATGVEALGPAPALMERRAGRHRFQLLLLGASRAKLHAVLAPWLAAVTKLPLARRVRHALDVDPADLA